MVFSSVRQDCPEAFQRVYFTLSVTNLPKKLHSSSVQVGRDCIVSCHSAGDAKLVKGVGLPVPIAELLVNLLGMFL